jgi:hypothetical protein
MLASRPRQLHCDLLLQVSVAQDHLPDWIRLSVYEYWQIGACGWRGFSSCTSVSEESAVVCSSAITSYNMVALGQ